MTSEKPAILIALYADPEQYPPTLSVAAALAKRGKNVCLLARHLKPSAYDYPAYVNVVRSHALVSQAELSKRSKWQKMGYFIRFCQRLYRLIRQHRPQLVICHDLLAAFAFFLIEKLLPETTFWYHSHDVIHLHTVKGISVFRFAKAAEPKILEKADIFSIPVPERKPYYPLEKFRGRYYTVPNYPPASLAPRQPQAAAPPQAAGAIRLIYQGSLGDNHGFEALIAQAGKRVLGLPLTITLIGPIRPAYKAVLEKAIKQSGVEDFVDIHPPVPYSELFDITAAHHIGLATHLPGKRVIYTLGATSSNKIYEYAALGKPVLLFDSPHYREYLGDYVWTAFTDLSADSIRAAIQSLITGYETKGQRAKEDFIHSLNYEAAFKPVWEDIAQKFEL